MRGYDRPQSTMLTLVNPEQRVPAKHPMRRIKELADVALTELSPLFDEMYSESRAAVDPARAAAEGLAADGAVHRAQRADVLRAARLQPVVPLVPRYGCGRAELRPFDLLAATGRGCWSTTWRASFSPAWSRRPASLQLLSDEHFTVDGTLIEAWASLKSFKRKDQGPTQAPDDPGNPTVDFHGERRSNRDPSIEHRPRSEAGEEGRGQGSEVVLLGQRADGEPQRSPDRVAVEPADGYAERESARAMLETALPGSRRITLGADKGYDTAEFVASCRALKVTPHVAQQ